MKIGNKTKWFVNKNVLATVVHLIWKSRSIKFLLAAKKFEVIYNKIPIYMNLFFDYL